ncbi:Uncharacterized protein FWK35_00033515 [Aphis craccivora]|uniref:Uncharacterized protein n=1 Tax=Aphis craccivora TaxID=307492 RepID=A0A6G0VQH0_APHCR|nr:Uncharacterized protein FWK35_00033515 [Aphis craccivora]
MDFIIRNPESAAKYTWKSAESCMRWCRRRSLPTVPGTLRELADQFQSGLLERYQSRDEVIYKGCVEDTSGNNSIVFASKTLILKTLEMEITEMHIDATFRVVPSTPKSYQLLIMNAMVNNHVSYNNISKYAQL